ncbi:MAG: PilW family protein [Candidatus Xenobium sp.]
MRTRHKQAGATLIEVLTYMALASMVFLAIYGIFMAGRRYFEIARASIEVQQALNTVGSRLTRDLMETHAEAIQSYPNNKYPSLPVGIVFLSARDDQNVFQYDPNYGVPIWQKYVGYYLDTDPNYPDNPRMRALYVAEVKPSGFPKIRPEQGTVNNVTTATIRNSGQNRRLLAHCIQAPPYLGSRGGFNCYAIIDGVKYGSSFINPIYVELEMVNTAAGVARTGGADSNMNSITSFLKIEGRS